MIFHKLIILYYWCPWSNSYLLCLLSYENSIFCSTINFKRHSSQYIVAQDIFASVDVCHCIAPTTLSCSICYCACVCVYVYLCVCPSLHMFVSYFTWLYACLLVTLVILAPLTEDSYILQAISDLLLPGGYLDSQSNTRDNSNSSSSNSSSSSSAGLGMGYYAKLEESGWLRHIRLILKAGILWKLITSILFLFLSILSSSSLFNSTLSLQSS